MDISQLLNSLKTTQRGANEQLVENVVMTLAAKVLEANYPEELHWAAQNRPDATASVGSLGPGVNAQYARDTGNMEVSRNANNNVQTMYLKKDKTGPGYTGDFYGNPTTDDVLNMVATLRHELNHARTNTGGISKSYPLSNMDRYLAPGQASGDLTDTLRLRQLPSMNSTYPIEEFLATAVPAATAKPNMGPVTRKQAGYADEIEQVLYNFPGVAKLIEDMKRPELFKKGK